MEISLKNAGKRYNREWIFRHFDYDFLAGKTYAITGPNGSGKSTLLQVIAGAIQHSEGTIAYKKDKAPIESPYLQLSFSAPYIELIEEMTADELLHFHSTFKPLIKSINDVLAEVGLGKASHKQIRYFSSGMKQRLKLAQAFFTKAPVLLLDEPTTNLDADGIVIYQQLIDTYAKDKLVIVSSNDKQEYGFCKEVIAINDYKKEDLASAKL